MKGKPFRDRDNQALHDKRMNESVRVAISRKNIEFILAHQHDSREELARYLRQCKKALGHVPAQSEIIGGDLLALRFGSWEKALSDSGYLNSIGHAVSAFPLERTAIFQAEYEHQSELHKKAKQERKKNAEAERRARKSEKKKAKKAAAAGASKCAAVRGTVLTVSSGARS